MWRHDVTLRHDMTSCHGVTLRHDMTSSRHGVTLRHDMTSWREISGQHDPEMQEVGERLAFFNTQRYSGGAYLLKLKFRLQKMQLCWRQRWMPYCLRSVYNFQLKNIPDGFLTKKIIVLMNSNTDIWSKPGKMIMQHFRAPCQFLTGAPNLTASFSSCHRVKFPVRWRPPYKKNKPVSFGEIWGVAGGKMLRNIK